MSDTNAYFNVDHTFNAYLEPWPTDHPLATESELMAMLPVGLQLISQVKALEASCLVQLRHLDDEAKSVVDYLKLQSKKIDLVLQHVIEQQQQQGECYKGVSFGGSGLRLVSPTVIDKQHYKVTLHIREELVSILCIAHVDTITEQDDGLYRIDLSFSQIIEADVEQLVKASLSVQQKQLRQRKQRNHQS
ncbi:hypothetical protein [Shewanella waksmanii]|uniref:hypothetical protein n=1 Tax=Shewanella waksmanii TaxID=213783 RepID=UPI00048FE2DC|nr:hypothetical protein [Shewanella waksmanii]